MGPIPVSLLCAPADAAQRVLMQVGRGITPRRPLAWRRPRVGNRPRAPEESEAEVARSCMGAAWELGGPSEERKRDSTSSDIIEGGRKADALPTLKYDSLQLSAEEPLQKSKMTCGHQLRPRMNTADLCCHSGKTLRGFALILDGQRGEICFRREYFSTQP